MRRLAALLLAAWLPAAAVWAESPAPRSLSAEQLQRLGDGEPLIWTRRHSDGAGRVELVTRVPGPPDEVWAIVDAYPDYASWFPDQEESSVLASQGATKTLSGTVDLPFPLRDRSFHLTDVATDVTVDGVRRRAHAWTYIAGSGNIVSSTGFTLVEPWPGPGGGTLVRMVAEADFGVPVPDFVMNWGARRMMRRVAAALASRWDALY
jgi:hypothetical protein